MTNAKLIINTPMSPSTRSPGWSKNKLERKTKFTFDEAVDVWLRHWAGQTGDQIAYDYRINAGRVSEVLKGHKHPGSKAVALRIWQGRRSA